MPTKENYANAPAGSTLTVGAASTDTTLTVNSTTSFPSTGQFRVICGGEIMIASVSTSTVLNVTRAQEGTTASTLGAGLFVVPVITDKSLRSLVRQSLNGTNISARRETNFIPGLGMSIALSDNSGNDACDITFTAGVDAALSPPVLANFSWTNQGAASVVQSGNSLFLADSAPSSSGPNLRILSVATVATPYTYTMNMIPILPGANYFFAGMVLYESGSSKARRFGIQSQSSGGITIDAFTAPTTFSSNMLTLSVGGMNPRWFRITDDGTNRAYWLSPNGTNWTKFYTEARATGFTTAPDHIGFCIDSQQSSGILVSSVLINSWAQS